jgi:hypothetical protein
MSVEQWNGLEKITDATAQKCCALDNRAVSSEKFKKFSQG